MNQLIGTWNDENPWNIKISENDNQSVRADPEDQQHWNYALIRKNIGDPNFPYKIYFFVWGLRNNKRVIDALQYDRPYKAKLVGNKLKMELNLGYQFLESEWTRVEEAK